MPQSNPIVKEPKILASNTPNGNLDAGSRKLTPKPSRYLETAPKKPPNPTNKRLITGNITL